MIIGTTLIEIIPCFIEFKTKKIHVVLFFLQDSTQRVILSNFLSMHKIIVRKIKL